MRKRRNLDHIGGGNLLRNLDHIGGGFLLRDVDGEKKSESDESEKGGRGDDKNSGDHVDAVEFIIDPKDVQSWLDEHPGGDILADSQFGKDQKFPWIQNLVADDDRVVHSPHGRRQFLGFVDSLGGGKFVADFEEREN